MRNNILLVIVLVLLFFVFIRGTKITEGYRPWRHWAYHPRRYWNPSYYWYDYPQVYYAPWNMDPYGYPYAKPWRGPVYYID